MARGSINPTLYLAPPEHSFWKWDEEGQVVTWSAGETIAFRSEIEQVLRRLAPAGLPPFSPVLLVLAACRDSIREALGHQENLVGLVGGLGNPGSPELQNVVDGLIRISQLPGDLRHPIEA